MNVKYLVALVCIVSVSCVHAGAERLYDHIYPDNKNLNDRKKSDCEDRWIQNAKSELDSIYNKNGEERLTETSKKVLEYLKIKTFITSEEAINIEHLLE